ncbi:hypothetical protein H072_5275 [Dactylellina haptotyla CBS 200.50]|uniref:DUF7587 domain-containing protein n=1 Tax=Dactylellina haptotyla (strain CBS 200.50) TaxID=1284197 RepID=S8ACZ5_DACHA|nr:hypothetical protein H072_5275 [Dactylellina haptotyla CBS 200.50]
MPLNFNRVWKEYQDDGYDEYNGFTQTGDTPDRDDLEVSCHRTPDPIALEYSMLQNPEPEIEIITSASLTPGPAPGSRQNPIDLDCGSESKGESSESDTGSVRSMGWCISLNSKRKHFKWSNEDKQDLLLFKIFFKNTNLDIARTLSSKHAKERTISAIVTQFNEKNKPGEGTFTIYQNLRQSILDQLAGFIGFHLAVEKFDEELRSLQLHAADCRIKLVYKPVTDIIADLGGSGQLNLSQPKYKKRRNATDLESDSDSSYSSSLWASADEVVPGEATFRSASNYKAKAFKPELPLSRTSGGPKILYRVYNEYSHGGNSYHGFHAGAFPNFSGLSIPILSEIELPKYDWNLGAHLSGEKLPEGSMFVSCTNSLFHALHLTAKMKGRIRIASIDTSKILQPTQHVVKVRHRLNGKGVIKNIGRYKGAFEYVVYGGIPWEAIISDISLLEISEAIRSSPEVKILLCPPILFEAGPKARPKLTAIEKSPISPDTVRISSQLLTSVFLGRTSRIEIKDEFRRNLGSDWQIRKRKVIRWDF